MSTLLASIYDGRGKARSALIAVDSGTGQASRLPLSLPSAFARCMGLCLGGGYVHVLVAADERSALLTLDRSTLTQVAFAELCGVRDGHGVTVRGQHMYVVSSGTDEVIRFLMHDHLPVQRTVIWAASEATRDTCHLNDLNWHRDSLLVSAFGTAPRSDPGQSGAGFIYDVSAGRMVTSGLSQPHSVTDRRGDIYWCESPAGCLRTDSRIVVELDGYLRGAAWLSDEVVCLGTSEGRPPRGSPHASAEDCALWFVNVESRIPLRRVPLTQFGPEVYGVLHLPAR